MLNNIRVYDAFATEELIEKSNGLCILSNVLRCEATQRAGGEFYIELEYALNIKDDINYSYLVVGNIIECPIQFELELFRITDVDRTDNSKISLVAEHILFDLDNFFLEDVRAVNETGSQALNIIFDNAVNDKNEVNPYHCTSDIEDISTAYYIRKNLIESLIETDNCFIETWGGNIVYNRFISLY